MPVISGIKLYVINPQVATPMVINYPTISYAPKQTYFSDQGYTMAVSQSDSGSGAPITWASIDNSAGKITVATTNEALAGPYTIAINALVASPSGDIYTKSITF